MMNLFAVSDLHISGPDDPLYSSLMSLLLDRASAGDVVVLAGDLFDLFVGNKEIFVERYASFLHALARAGKRGVEIHYIEGNHDFLMQGIFKNIGGVHLHSDEYCTELSGR